MRLRVPPGRLAGHWGIMPAPVEIRIVACSYRVPPLDLDWGSVPRVTFPIRGGLRAFCYVVHTRPVTPYQPRSSFVERRCGHLHPGLRSLQVTEGGSQQQMEAAASHTCPGPPAPSPREVCAGSCVPPSRACGWGLGGGVINKGSLSCVLP